MQQHAHKMRNKRLIAGSAILLVLGIGSLSVDWLHPSGPAHVPDIVLSTLDGEKIALRQRLGRPLLINFWATSCAQCLQEIPQLIALHRDAAAQGLEIIGIAMPYDRPDHVIATSKARQLPYRIALDIDGTATRSFGDVQLTPSFFLIAPDGRIVHRATGHLNAEIIRTMLKKMTPRTTDISISLPAR